MAIRRAAPDGWAILPSAGRPGKAPVWPLVSPSERELEVWRQLWHLPQATMWERLHQELEVALYTRMVARYEQPDSKAALGQLIARSADGLGLTITGMRANRWRVAETEQTGRHPAGQKRANSQSLRAQFQAQAKSRTPARDRFAVVPPAAEVVPLPGVDDLGDGA